MANEITYRSVNKDLEENNSQSSDSDNLQLQGSSNGKKFMLKKPCLVLLGFSLIIFALGGLNYYFFPDNTHHIMTFNQNYNYHKPNQRYSFLFSALNIQKYALSYTLSEQVDRLWLIEPFYQFVKVPLTQQLHENFVSNALNIGLSVAVIEGLFHTSKPNLQPRNHQNYVYMTTQLEVPLYIRENLINVVVKKNWERIKDGFILWIDAHQISNNPYWFEDFIYNLGRYNSVQGFQDIELFDTRNVSYNTHTGVGYYYSYSQGDISSAKKSINLGNSWGITADYYQEMGYLLDEAVCMCADCYFTFSVVSKNHSTLESDLLASFKFPNYYQNFDPWVSKSINQNKGKYGIVRGNLYHIEHEHPLNYDKMLQTCDEGKFNIKKDLVRDKETWQLTISPDSHWWRYFKELYSWKNNF